MKIYLGALAVAMIATGVLLDACLLHGSAIQRASHQRPLHAAIFHFE
jgi:hypothetical protein